MCECWGASMCAWVQSITVCVGMCVYLVSIYCFAFCILCYAISAWLFDKSMFKETIIQVAVT